MSDVTVTARGWADKVAAVCIGGPFDGQRRVEPGPKFEYIQYPGVASYEVDPQAAREPVKTTRGMYVAHMICGSVIWVDQSLSIDGAMRHMVDSYGIPAHLRAKSPRSGAGEHQ